MSRQNAPELLASGHYELLEKLGEGGMGVVYKAHDSKLDRIVALKFLHPDLLASVDGRNRFLREARAVSRLNHANIAVIHSIEESAGNTFLVFEFLPGGTLKSRLMDLRLQGRLLTIPEAVTFGLQMAGALAHAHAHAVIHRDVKPALHVRFERGRTPCSAADIDQSPTQCARRELRNDKVRMV